MNRQNQMVSPPLEAERDCLLHLIQFIRDSGSVAPFNIWISPAPQKRANLPQAQQQEP